MINVVLIDDERPALRLLEHLLKNYSDINVLNSFTNPIKALDKIEELNPDVVFLDVNMPQLKGIDAASVILDRCSNTDVIFVTAYEQYAVDAFEVYALDYILKPIVIERLDRAIARLRRKHPIAERKNPEDLIIHCFGSPLISWIGEEPFKWRTKKTKELFLYLLQRQGRIVTKEELADQIWPEADINNAYHQLYSGIYYLRKSLKEYNIDESMISIDSSYCLRLGSVQSDTMYFLENVKNFRQNTLDEMIKLEQVYTNDYLEDEDFHWADYEIERIFILYINLLITISECLIEKKDYRQAETYLIKGFYKNPFEELFIELLLTIYTITNEKIKASVFYNKFSKLLHDELNILPSIKISKLYESIK